MIIEIKDVTKSYGSNKVLDNFNLKIESDYSYVVTGKPGCGKTTLVRILLGLESMDSGSVNLLGDYKYPYVVYGTVFQDDRLVMGLSAIDNIFMVSKNLYKENIRLELLKFLPEEALHKPVQELTQGQRRLVAIVRACCISSDILVMDEPFAGLTLEDKEKAITYIRDKQGSGPLLITATDTEGLDFARIINL